jgi:hypothetical protein
MEHVGVMAGDPIFRWSDRVILDLHFDACYFQADKSPGRWRTTPIGVTGSGGRVIYQGEGAGNSIRRFSRRSDVLVNEPSEHVSAANMVEGDVGL